MIGPLCDSGDHLNCAGCGCTCHPPGDPTRQSAGPTLANGFTYRPGDEQAHDGHRGVR